MLLNQIATSGFTGMAPTPVEKYAINKYFVNNDLFNLMEFVNIGMGSNIGNLQATIVTYDTPDSAEFRRIGNEYDISNNVPKTVTVVLKMLGGEFQTDRVLERAFSQNPTAVDNWTEQQIGQKINSIINGFCKYFIQGNSDRDEKQFDGLEKYFNGHPSQNGGIKELPGGLSYANALSVEEFLNESVVRVVDRPTCVITSRLKGKPFLQALEQHRNRGVRAINVYDREYYTFMGIPIVGLSDDCFPASMTNKGIPFIFAKFAEMDGIRVAVPMNPGVGQQGAILDIVRPRLGNTDAGTSVFVRNGGVEMVCAPIIEDPFCASICYIEETQVVNAEAIEVNGPDQVALDDQEHYMAEVFPLAATNHHVVWSVTPGTGKAIIDAGGVLTALAVGKVLVVATAADGSGVTGTCLVNITEE
jgi:uncharacterized protein YjdB